MCPVFRGRRASKCASAGIGAPAAKPTKWFGSRRVPVRVPTEVFATRVVSVFVPGLNRALAR
eukprot:10362255-Lingulodinium_polyedra.AAC.1